MTTAMDDYQPFRQQPQSKAAPAATQDRQARARVRVCPASVAAALRQQLAPHKKQADKLEQELLLQEKKLAAVEDKLGG